MLNKINTIIIISVSLLFSSYGQTRLQKAHKEYEYLSYFSAAKKYEKLVGTKHESPDLIIRLANCYYKIGEFKKALIYYQKVALENYAENELYNYIHTAKNTENDSLSKQLMIYFCEKFNSISCQEMLPFTHFIERTKEFPFFSIDKLPINSATNNEFGAYIAQENELFFLSDRLSNKVVSRKNSYNNRGFFSIYHARKTENNQYTEPKKIHGAVNSKFNEGTLCISPDGMRVYFTRNNKNKGQKRFHQLGIYLADIDKNGKWKNIRPLSINSTDYSVAHPTLTSEGKKLIFSSTQPGGYGQADLYIAEVKENGDISNIVNLGDRINTSRNELFPSVDSKGNLYFASDGHFGLGGMDIFMATEGNTTQIINCGVPINSPKDDFAFVLSDDGQNGFVSSNRSGLDDIYAVQILKPIDHGEYITGYIVERGTSKPVTDALLSIRGQTFPESFVGKTDSTGAYRITLPYNLTRSNGKNLYELRVKKHGYQIRNLPLEQFLSEGKTNFSLHKINQGDALDDISIYFDTGSATLRTESEKELQKVVDMINMNPNMIIEAAAHTDCQSSAKFNLNLSKRRANNAVKYVRNYIQHAQQIYGKGYGENYPIIKCGCETKNKCTSEEMQQNRRVEFIIKHM